MLYDRIIAFHPAAASFAGGVARTPGCAAAARDASKRRAYRRCPLPGQRVPVLVGRVRRDARPSAEVVQACLAPRVWVWGVWFGFELRGLAMWRVCAIAPSFISGWRAFSSVSLCKSIITFQNRMFGQPCSYGTPVDAVPCDVTLRSKLFCGCMQGTYAYCKMPARRK
jgi:hypothetical protein